MRSNLPLIQRRIASNLAESGTLATLRWVEVTGGVEEPVSGAVISGVETAMSSGVMCFEKTVEQTSREHSFLNLREGARVLDFDPEAPLDKPGLRIEIDGQMYAPAKVPGGTTPRQWDAVVAGQRLMRTLIVEPAA
jgi:hypothetical protein